MDQPSLIKTRICHSPELWLPNQLELGVIAGIFTSNGMVRQLLWKHTLIRWNLSFIVNLLAVNTSSTGNEVANEGYSWRILFSRKCATFTSFDASWDTPFTWQFTLTLHYLASFFSCSFFFFANGSLATVSAVSPSIIVKW
jgi:hypothetical protein